MAHDNFSREIDYLRISVTDACNMGCVYCMPAARPARFAPQELFTVAELRRIVRAAMGYGVRKLRLTGGEPLMRPDIVEIVSMLKTLGVRDLSLTTNGSMLAAMAPALKAAGLDRVNVSLDSLRPQRYAGITGGAELARVLEGIESARGVGLEPVKLNMVPIRGLNDDEIAAFAALTLERDMHIRFIEFMPAGHRALWSDERCVKVLEMMQRVTAEVGPLVRQHFKGDGPSRNYRIEGARGVVGFISPVSHGFCSMCNRLRLNAAGRLRPCLFSRTEVDVLGPLRAGASDAELSRLVGLAISVKPEGSYLANDPSSVANVPMSSIGG